MDGYELTTDRSRIDLSRVQRWLSEQSYWAAGRPLEVVQRSVDGSQPYALLHGGELVAFARVVTDGVTFAWLCDVFVDPAHRGRGLATRLVDTVVGDLAADGVYRFALATADAHGVYARSGFGPLAEPQRWMELDRR